MELFEQPWRKLSDETLPNEVMTAPGWLLAIERKLLWWIGAKYWRGEGAIIDAGAFCGASAAAFGSGVLASPALAQNMHAGSKAGFPSPVSRRASIVSFDKFVDVDYFEQEFIETAFGARLRPGDSFLDYYIAAVRPYLDVLRIEAGDFLQKKWSGQPIEVLFLDICKTRQLNAHAMSEFLPHLIPGHSLIVQQDFMGVWLPHIGWTMQYLKDYFEIVDSECGPSRVYLLRTAIPQNAIDDIASGSLSLDRRLELLDQLYEDSLTQGAPDTAMLVKGMKLQELVLDREIARHDAMWREFLDHYSLPHDVAEDSFAGSNCVIEGVPNWIPRQIMSMRELRRRWY